MANRKLRKIEKKLAGRIRGFEAENTKDNKHEHHRPGSQNLRNQ